MKIVHIIFGLNIGGAEKMLARLIIQQHINNDLEHVVISLSDIGMTGEHLRSRGISVRALKCKSLISFIVKFFHLRRLLYEERPAVVHTWMYHANFFGGLASYSVGIRNIIWAIRANHVKASRLSFTIISLKLGAWLSAFLPQKIIYVGMKSANTHSKLGYTNKKSLVIPNGYDPRDFVIDDYKRRCLRNEKREELGIRQEEIVIISVARVHPVKDHDAFFAAAKILLDRYSHLKFVLIGSGTLTASKFMANFIQDEIKQNKFLFLGEQLDVGSYLLASDIFCLHSISEGFPNALGEAMLHGLPCVSTNVGEAEQMLNSKQHLVEPSCPINLARGLENLVKLDSQERLEIGLFNQRRILDEYTIKKISDQYADVYRDMA